MFNIIYRSHYTLHPIWTRWYRGFLACVFHWRYLYTVILPLPYCTDLLSLYVIKECIYRDFLLTYSGNGREVTYLPFFALDITTGVSLCYNKNSSGHYLLGTAVLTMHDKNPNKKCRLHWHTISMYFNCVFFLCSSPNKSISPSITAQQSIYLLFKFCLT